MLAPGNTQDSSWLALTQQELRRPNVVILRFRTRSCLLLFLTNFRLISKLHRPRLIGPGELRKEEHLRPGVQDQRGQYVRPQRRVEML